MSRRSCSATAGGRPNRLWFNLRYQLYDWDNTTPTTVVNGETTTFPVTEYVRFDQVVEEFVAGAGAEPFSYKRQSSTPTCRTSLLPFTAVRLGYSRESDKRTFREFEHTTDNIFRMAVDTTGWSYLQLRAQYDYAKRTGIGLDEEVFDAENEGFAQPRQFDISDRNRHRFTFLATGTPDDKISLERPGGRVPRGSARHGVRGPQHRRQLLLGRRGRHADPESRHGPDLGPGRIQVAASVRARRTPACRRPTCGATGRRTSTTTPTRSTPTSICCRRSPKTDVRYSFDWMDGLNDITYGLRPDQTIFTTVPLIQLPNASHTMKRSMLDVMYRINRRFGAGASWYYESYDVNDWAWNDCGTPCANGNGTAAVPPSPTLTLDNITLNPPRQANNVAQDFAVTRYMYRPYDGNTFAVRLRVFF